MARVALTGGAYEARSIIAGAQRCINLIPEAIPADEGEPAPMAHYPTPGLRQLLTVGTGGVRGVYRAPNDTLYFVVGNALYRTTGTYVPTFVGTLGTSSGMVSMADNSVTLLVVDGSASGYTVNLISHAFATVVSAAFYGANKVDTLDGFFVLNRPGTNQFYLSDSIATTFNPLDIAATVGLDNVVSLAVIRRELWVFGERGTYIYQNVGALDFPLQAISGGIDHGCVAAQSVCKNDGGVLWLSRDRDGIAIVLRGAQYQAKRISTHAIEAAIQGYSRSDDAIGWIYQRNGHTIYVLSFPTANATWCYDLATNLWHKWESSGGRHRGVCQTSCFGPNIVGDYALPILYALDPYVYTDNGAAIQRTRSFPHMVKNGQRVFYTQFIADMQCGTIPAGQSAPIATLRWSDDHGATFVGTQTETLGVNGATLTSVQFQRLGMARDRVFELSWNAPIETALLGAFVQTKVSAS